MTPMLIGVGVMVFITALLYVYRTPTNSSAKTADPFELGEYYFNADNDVDGTYDLELARAAYSKALSEDPAGNPLVWYQLGRIDFLEGRYIAALYKFDRQIEYFGDAVPNVYYMRGLASAYQAQQTNKTADWDVAEENFKRYIEIDPAGPWAYVDLSWVYFSEGKYEDMLPVIEEGLASNPAQPWLLNMYGLALLNTGESGRALEAFTEAEAEAEKLTTEEWGRAYPGNNPREWEAGLESFMRAIRQNKELVSN